jgi:hypothetical protein
MEKVVTITIFYLITKIFIGKVPKNTKISLWIVQYHFNSPEKGTLELSQGAGAVRVDRHGLLRYSMVWL